MRYWIRSISCGISVLAACTLSQCANKEVKQQLDKSVQIRGESFARELQAQSPFEKVSLSWTDAKELMKERNPAYQKAVASQIEADSKDGLVREFTYQVKKSLVNTATQTLNPREIAKAINNPVGELPKKFESLTDLKNISHSLEQKEWARVGQVVDAEKTTRVEMVKLHVLFREEKLIEEQASLLEKYEKLAEGKPNLEKIINAKRTNYKKQRETWLNSVRDFFNAEYYDVEFKNSKAPLTLYRTVADPQFGQWRRWRTLGHSQELVQHLSEEHKDNKPAVPGMNTLKSTLGITNFQNNLVVSGVTKSGLRGEVRSMLKKWRELKSTQSKILELQSKQSPETSTEAITAQDIEQEFKLYQFLQAELKLVSFFWMLDENCWS